MGGGGGKRGRGEVSFTSNTVWIESEAIDVRGTGSSSKHLTPKYTFLFSHNYSNNLFS